jgi:hypothetical protein
VPRPGRWRARGARRIPRTRRNPLPARCPAAADRAGVADPGSRVESGTPGHLEPRIRAPGLRTSTRLRSLGTLRPRYADSRRP